ncbi:MAG: hypothetical protein ABIK23_07885 [candidate division WOR-3 bacterium]
MNIWLKKLGPVFAGIVAFIVLFSGCENRAPSVPIVSGTERARPNDTIVVYALSVDKEGDSISYLFDWSNEEDSVWSEWLPSGVECFRKVAFLDTGGYFLRVKARDARKESGWSDTFFVTIRFYQPLVPKRPAGPDTVVVNDTVAFASSANHPLGESMALQFDWGDTIGEWSGFFLPGTIVADRHAWSGAGVYEVRCRAKDRKGFISDWSLPETVWVFDSLF